ncbi:outer membrane protein [Desulfovibrio legallii]|uniref:Outer membrane autotransporter barrel domain-containing protein n=1 Tax=Desulfovibrio legallii TaxID=571438 RepID=A0A1G7PK98_9BACT|nr:outer membrane beta-barrel protein [Desulfovibrio legallii]SDF86792.1 outer membrane autotransporter barrel domain-containing protein [Desulfovibrio legallii]
MKRIIAALALVLTLALPGMAAAEGTGMYLAPKFLMSIQSTGNTERTDALAGTGVDSYNQFTLGGAFALGYDFWPQQMLPLRAEVEFALRGNNEKTWSDGGQYIQEVKGTWNSSTLFANLFWDFHNDSAFTPYVGAGLGLAFNYVGYDFTDNNGNKFSADDRFTNFAWNVGAGVAYNFNENFAIDASYRFVGLGYNEVSATNGGRKYEIGNRPYNNEFMVGLRFAF